MKKFVGCRRFTASPSWRIISEPEGSRSMKYIPRLTLICKHAVFIALLLFATAPAARAQSETWEPWTMSPWMVAARVWTSGDHTFARVNLTLPTPCHRVVSVGPVTRQGNDQSVDYITERYTGGCVQVIALREDFFDLGALEPGTYTFTVKSRGTPVANVTFNPNQVVEHWEETSIPDSTIFAIWTAGGVTFTEVRMNF